MKSTDVLGDGVTWDTGTGRSWYGQHEVVHIVQEPVKAQVNTTFEHADLHAEIILGTGLPLQSRVSNEVQGDTVDVSVRSRTERGRQEREATEGVTHFGVGVFKFHIGERLGQEGTILPDGFFRWAPSHGDTGEATVTLVFGQ